ncbi:EamA-like transporter family protein, partial [Salmonella enterica subsp. enterica serovar Typhimurium]|nr:EamA-like transporter family protein [Salmonella enterica subsp. enterica serovar Typhimurium]
LDIARSHGVTLRAMVGPAFGALLLVIGAWLIAKRQF